MESGIYDYISIRKVTKSAAKDNKQAADSWIRQSQMRSYMSEQPIPTLPRLVTRPGTNEEQQKAILNPGV